MARSPLYIGGKYPIYGFVLFSLMRYTTLPYGFNSAPVCAMHECRLCSVLGHSAQVESLAHSSSQLIS